MQVVIPDVGDVAVESLHVLAAPLCFPTELAGCRETLIEQHAVEPRMLESFGASRLQRHEGHAGDERKRRGGEPTLQHLTSVDHYFPRLSRHLRSGVRES